MTGTCAHGSRGDSAGYVGFNLFPCDECDHEFYCVKRKKTCAPLRHWEKYGSVLKKDGVIVPQVPDQDLD